MRIHKIRFKNLNSLVGEWVIDLGHPAFTTDGLFAITGPTGSGKSTILDAICLALYGRTPRLGKISKSGNEIMSRRTGECFAEVTFTTQKGRFRCHWSQHRARKQPEGELQAPKHEIADADSGRIFEARLKGVADRIEAATGMDFDRFTRSMLLAQGGFAAFLQAAPDERAPILEQITGTEIYSRISIQVHARQRAERERLQLLQAETAGIVLLEPEQEAEIRLQLAAGLQEETSLTVKAAATQQAITWLAALAELQREINGLAEEADRLQGELAAFQPARDRLAQAARAALLDGAHATLTGLRQQHTEDREALQAGEAALPAQEAAAREQAEALHTAEQRTQAAKEALNSAAPLIQKVRALDQQLADQHKAVADEEDNRQKEEDRIDAVRQTRQREQDRRGEAEKNLAAAHRYIKEHAGDEWLTQGLTGLEEQLTGLLARERELAQKTGERKAAAAGLERAVKALDRRRRQCADHSQQLEAAVQKLRQDKEALALMLDGRLLRELRAEKDTLLLELNTLTRIAQLEAHRASLEQGAPCPLCGALEHPFAAGQVPAPDATEQRIKALDQRIAQAERREDAIRLLEAAETAARQALAESEKQEVAATHEHKAAQKTLADLQVALDTVQAEASGLRQAISARLRPLGMTASPDLPVTSLREQLRARLQAWQDQVRKQTEIEQRLAESDGELKRLDAVIETRVRILAGQQERLAERKRAYAAGREERKLWYGEQNPDEEELRLHQAMAAAETAEKQARTRRDALHQQLHTAQAQVEALQQRIARRRPELRQAETALTAALATAGFADEHQFLAARLGSSERDQLTEQARALDNRWTELQARQRDRTARLATEQARALTDSPLAELEARRKAHEEALNTLRDTLFTLKHRLEEQAAARERLQERQAAIEAQKTECRRWDNLHELIGSADGKRFRNFAQGLTFEVVISHANRQLRKMTDRYLLVHTQSLELSVIDSYQAGEIRSTKNLSGGESFIVSLALALGLSRMAGQKVQVESLFLDEGFGALDDEALDTALDTLASLQQDGKLIGVISHVPALKERIASQIQVSPQTGGRSRISGPGCQG